MENGLTMASTSSFVTDLKINSVSADVISLSYDTLPGNVPSTYGNFVAIWQNQNQIPWNQDPLKTQAISTNSQAGSLAFTELPSIDNNSYIIGYSVGPLKEKGEGLKYGNICSTAFVPAASNHGETRYQYFRSEITLQHVGTTSVVVQFNLPDGYQPAANKNWMGIWRSSAASYNNPPDYAAPITINSSFGTSAFNNVRIGRGLTYTIAYFMGGWVGEGQNNKQTAMACTLTFTNS